MKKNVFIHVMNQPELSFNKSYCEFLNNNFDTSNHRILFISRNKIKVDFDDDKIIWIDKKIKIFLLLKYLIISEKIFIHGLFSRYIVFSLFLLRFVLKKCYWFAWGGDFLFPERHNYFRKYIIKNIGYIVTFLEEDYKYIVKHYKTKAKYIHALVYYAGIEIKINKIKTTKDNMYHILAGHSGNPNNNHCEMFTMIKNVVSDNIKIFTPLSYAASTEYRNKICEFGKKLFKENFNPIVEMMPLKEYLTFLNNIDFGLFGQKNQAGLGNIIYLIGIGKKVYIKKNSSHWIFFKKIGVSVYDIDDFNIEPIEINESKKNNEIINNYFSLENYKRDYNKVFNM